MSIVTDVQELLDETGGSTFWTTDHIYDAINESLLMSYCEDRFITSTATATIAENSEWMAVPNDILIPQYVTMGGKEYWPSSYANLERWNENWRGAAPGQPVAFIPVSWNVMRVWPAADAQYYPIVYGVPWPPEVSDSATDFTGERAYKRYIMYKAGASLVRNTLPQFAQMWEADALEEKYRWRASVRNNRGFHRIYRLRPGTAFTVAQKGNPYNMRNWR